ncbi:restriction endonuclease subunit S [Algoriphagus sp. A40]|uniref:restriction endonuclease subunit S n=1 Tax=Algoriphagus sp. A40 TaxID=1945863 RepID=UPI0009864FD8|nr:restriction endonuclease subunit S [Algoriphagus sp. A40]OOG69499.1 hypothetical protein B0E43_21135 [Algoriphagus sp. A40]
MSDSLINSVETKPKLAPKLRFPEFEKDGDWEEKTLGEVAERIEDKVNGKQLTTASISAGIGFVSQAEKFSRDISGDQYKNYIVLNEGEFSYNKGNSKRFPQGCIYKLKEFKQVAVPNAFISFRFKPNFIGDFFQGYFDNNYHGRQLQQFITSGARMDGLLNIRAKDFFSIVLPTPSKPEQEKIAGCLSSLDEMINANKEKLEALKAHKKGLMQNLFPQEGQTIPTYRFPEFENYGEWMEKKLGELLEFKNGINASKEQYGKGIKFINVMDILSNELITYEKIIGSVDVSKEIVEKFSVEYGDILFQRSSETQEEVGSANVYIDNNKTATFGGFVIRGKKIGHYDPLFLNVLLKTKEVRNSISSRAGGSTRYNVGQEVLSTTKILIPLIEEQNRIASCLSSLDDLIKSQTKKIEQLHNHKKGLMQGLFPKNLD